MNLQELKAKVESNNIQNTDSCVLQYSDTNYIPMTYIRKISNDKKWDVIFIENLQNYYESNNSFFDVNNSIYVYMIDKLTEQAIFNKSLLFVVCKEIDKNINQEQVIKIPKLEEWMLKDYIISNVSITEKQVDDLFPYIKDDVYKVVNCVEKLRYVPFDDVLQNAQMDNTRYTLFDLSNAIIRNDRNAIKNILSEYIQIDAFAFVGLLKKQFRQVIDIQLNPCPQADKIGLSDKQFWVIKKYNCNHYTKEQLVNIYTFLNNIDKMVKTGQIDSSWMLDYIITGVLSK